MAFALLASPALAARGGVLPLSADDGWLQFGNVVVLLFASAALASVGAYALRSLSRRPILFLVMFSVLSLVATIVADKTNGVNNLPPMPMPPRLVPVAATVTEDDVARGWRVECVTTNETLSYTMPSNAVYVSNWHVHGARSSFGNNVVNLGGASAPDWSFPLGTNGAAFSSFWYFIDGRIRPKPKDAAREICAVGVPMSAVPGKSRLWAMADGDCRVLTWENFFLGGDTNAPVNAQIRLFANGDFTTSSNDVETVCRRVNPDDWDGDGIPNSEDANPMSCDGDFFGPANVLPEGANTNAYCTVSVVATGPHSLITFTGDGPSNYPDPCFIAKSGVTNEVVILIGKTYQVSSEFPLSFVGVSDPATEIVPLRGSVTRVCRPVTITCSGGNPFMMSVMPDNLLGIFSWEPNCCGLVAEVAGMFTSQCSSGCQCNGCDVLGLYSYDGYSLSAVGGHCSCRSATSTGAVSEILCDDTILNNCGTNSVIPVRVRFGAEDSCATGYLADSGGKLRFWDSPDRDQEVFLPCSYENLTAPCEVTLWMEATATSDSYEDQSLFLVWNDNENRSGSAARRLTVVEPCVEPVCVLGKTIGDVKATYNPSCIVRDQRDEWYRISWIPSSYPGSRVSWSSVSGGVTFPFGNTGDEVCIRSSLDGANVGSIKIQFGDASGASPTFGFKGVQPMRVRMYVVPLVESEDDQAPAVANAEIEELDKVYSQVGIAFNVTIMPRVVFNDLRLLSLFDSRTWTGLDDPAGTGNGLVVFVSGHPINGSSAFTCGVGDRHIVIGAHRNSSTLAHEVGHAFGLRDIYTSSRESPYGRTSAELRVDRQVGPDCFADERDWNSGAGPGYYPPNTSHDGVIRRFLMYGKGGRRGDIPISAAWGVTLQRGPKVMFVPIGIENMVISDSLIEIGGAG